MSSSHVFLFRHCLRSTNDEVKLHMSPKEEARHNYSTKIQDYVAKDALPEWNTPQEWCTAQGIETMKGTGRWLAEELLKMNKNIRRVRFVSDISHRDVDTALALSLGITQALVEANQTLRWEGLGTIHLDPILFSPLEVSNFTQTTLCRLAVKRSQLAEEISARFQAVPKPSKTLKETLQELHKMANLTYLDDTLSLNKHGRIPGSLNLVQLLAEMAFYSHASNLTRPFLPSMDWDQLYHLIQWEYWSRSIQSVGNTESATNGAVMVERMIDALREENTVTIITGHDGDMDGVATALGLRWSLPDPYQGGDIAEINPTPPGSALHFSSYSNNRVGLRYLYPVYFTKGYHFESRNSTAPLNTTGILEATPFLTRVNRKYAFKQKRETHGGTLWLKGGPSVLENRAFSIMKDYPGAKECYMAATKRQKVGTQSSSSGRSSGPLMLMFLLGVLVVLAISLFLRMRKQKKKDKRPAEMVAFDTRNANDFDLELT